MNLQPNKILLDVKRLTVKFGNRQILKDVDLSLKKGQIVTVIGPNGSGKSTLLKAILGMVPLSNGSVNIAKHSKIGYIPQKFRVESNIPLTIQRFINLNNPIRTDKIIEALKTVGIDKKPKTLMESLSGGEIQRVFLARVLLRKPEILVLDEPVQGVDFQGQIYMYKLIRKIRDDLNCGVMLVSHDIHLVMKETDYVICLNGHICCQGLPTQIKNDSRFLEIIGAEVPDEKLSEIFAIYPHKHDHSHPVLKPSVHD